MGRPVSYDEDAVVNAALGQFWAAGFSACSIDALVGATGLNRHSLYQSFGGKSGLFTRVLERYLDDYSRALLTIFDRYTGVTALKRYFRAALSGFDGRGCLVANTAVELGDAEPAVHQLIAAYYGQVARCLVRAITQAQAAGDLRAELAPRATAWWLVRALHGLAVGARLGGQPALSADALLALLGASPGRRGKQGVEKGAARRR